MLDQGFRPILFATADSRVTKWPFTRHLQNLRQLRPISIEHFKLKNLHRALSINLTKMPKETTTPLQIRKMFKHELLEASSKEVVAELPPTFGFEASSIRVIPTDQPPTTAYDVERIPDDSDDGLSINGKFGIRQFAQRHVTPKRKWLVCHI
ncbi:MAG: hypothetical protein KDA69_07370 [Planctomycetaceae bacterium]|nr:hypothetical protein [Planctomycetaceae bacterium]MCA9044121.1 hypothetical protein [Planctomycetaceae bacterium]